MFDLNFVTWTKISFTIDFRSAQGTKQTSSDIIHSDWSSDKTQNKIEEKKTLDKNKSKSSCFRNLKIEFESDIILSMNINSIPPC